MNWERVVYYVCLAVSNLGAWFVVWKAIELIPNPDYDVFLVFMAIAMTVVLWLITPSESE